MELKREYVVVVETILEICKVERSLCSGRINSRRVRFKVIFNKLKEFGAATGTFYRTRQLTILIEENNVKIRRYYSGGFFVKKVKHKNEFDGGTVSRKIYSFGSSGGPSIRDVKNHQTWLLYILI